MDVYVDGFLNENDSYQYAENYTYVPDGNLKIPDDVVKDGRWALLLSFPHVTALCFGLAGHVTLLALLTRLKRQGRARISDGFAPHLGLTDLLLLATLPLWAVQASSSTGWSLGRVLCEISGSAFHVNYYFGIATVLCLAMDHCLPALGGPRLYSREGGGVAIQVSCILAWSVSVLFSLSDRFVLRVREKREGDDGEKYLLCDHRYNLEAAAAVQGESESAATQLLVSHGLGFFLPAGLATLLFCLRRCFGPRGGAFSPGSSCGPEPSVLAAFTVACWAPYNLALFAYVYCDAFGAGAAARSACEDALRYAFALGCFHACCRPVLYLGCAAVRPAAAAAAAEEEEEEEEPSPGGVWWGAEADGRDSLALVDLRDRSALADEINTHTYA